MFFTEHFIHFRIVFMVTTDILKTPKSNSNFHMSVTIFAFFHSVEHWLLKLAFLMFPSVETVTYFTWRFLIAIYSLSTLVREIPTWYQHERKVWKKIRNKAKDKKTSPHFVEGATIKLEQTKAKIGVTFEDFTEDIFRSILTCALQRTTVKN